MAEHILGYVGKDEHDSNITSGRDGIELSMNSRLAGVRGWRLTETDRQGRELVALREQDVAPHDGMNVVLTIDSVIQHIVETALQETMEKHQRHTISVILIRLATGELLSV